MTDGDVDDEIETEGVCVMVTDVTVGGVEVAVDVVVDTEEIHCALRKFVIN